jgi:hypothetical protein
MLESYAVKQDLINVIKVMCRKTELCIKVSGTKISKQVNVSVGLHHGCGLWPNLFNVFINKIIDLWENTTLKGIDIARDTELTHPVYADDQVLLALQTARPGLKYKHTKGS